MDTITTERRHDAAANASSADAEAGIVRRGILLQASHGSVNAIEYLKAQGIGSAVVVRVLSGGEMREDDQAALDAALRRP